MPNQSPLRKELEEAINQNIQFETTHSKDFPVVNINGTWVKLHIPYDAILDVLIHALPEYDYNQLLSSTNQSEYHDKAGYNRAVYDVKQLLLEAKGEKQ